MPKGDIKQLKADPEDGTTPIANLLLEALALSTLSGREKSVVLYLWRMTYGWSVNGERLKERAIPLERWALVTGGDKSYASAILSGLVSNKVIFRTFQGAGQGYVYSMNTRVGEWQNCGVNAEQLSNCRTEQLSKHGTVGLSKHGTPPATDLLSPKESIKERLKKDTTAVGTGGEKESFEDYEKNLEQRFPGLDWDMELEKFWLYWKDGKRKLKNPKLALLNWMTRAKEFNAKKGENKNGNGDDRRDTRHVPGNRPAGAFDGLD